MSRWSLVIRLMVAMSAIMVCDRSYAFWSISTYGIYVEIHQRITNAAMAQSYDAFNSSPGYPFSPRAIAATNEVHWQLDSPFGVYDPRDHFDSEQLQGAFTSIVIRRLQLMNELSRQPAPIQSNVWEELGEIFHAIQDFYAHSSWIATGHLGIADFGAATSSVSTTFIPPPPAFLMESTSIGSACNAQGTQLFVTDINVTSGYYEPLLPAPAGKCDHGSVPHLFENCGHVGIEVPVDGINHDASCFDDSYDSNIYVTALNLAQQETSAFIKSIVASLEAASNRTGFCALFDLPVTTDVCGGKSISIILTQPLTNTGITVTAGEVINVTAQGTMNWYTGACNNKCLSTPAGEQCSFTGFYAQGLACWSLIGQISGGDPFYVGTSLQGYVVPADGTFYLGVNDNNYPDNTGSWTASVTVGDPTSTD